ncbi:transcription factor Tfb2 [Fistulina hepatica ATCC 64428]|uniref:RNA polymerase II transcription factor B subunit 2 n=1 Tax=Fistulina hepatica ATCC 64428 TaxID=1128425 RepID=A0A0D7AS09_9AGAR|nr:transcription factor Tfb2 [Fistulina hepatica ATCC 64428]
MPSIHLHLSSQESQTEDTNAHLLLLFLQSQSQTILTRLYQRPSSSLSIFRLLSLLQQQIVMAMLWLESAITFPTMAAWVVPDAKSEYDVALASLARLHIVPKSPVKLALNSTFRASLRQAITGGGNQGSFGVPAPPDARDPPPDVDTLDSFALEQWETILHYMVSSGSGGNPARPSNDVLFLLERSGLMGKLHGVLRITSAGFQFLLRSPHAQLWDLLLQYLHLTEERNMDIVEILSFLFMLSTMEIGREYSAEDLSPSQKLMLGDLRDYGLVSYKVLLSARFSPTRLATTLTSSSPPLPTSSGAQDGFIILETNYRIYAYTDNPLQTAVLNLFVTLKYRFPNLVVGIITRESVKRALSNGISADQIISYLMAHAHPQMHKNNPLLPVTVQDQIRLWELERNRLKSQEGYLYMDFASQADYELVLNYAKSIGVVVWENPQKRYFFGTPDGHANIREFIERRSGGSSR